MLLYDENEENPPTLYVMSSTGNTDIHSPDSHLFFWFDFPISIIDVCQEKGRASWLPGEASNQLLRLTCDFFSYKWPRSKLWWTQKNGLMYEIISNS